MELRVWEWRESGRQTPEVKITDGAVAAEDFRNAPLAALGLHRRSPSGIFITIWGASGLLLVDQATRVASVCCEVLPANEPPEWMPNRL